MKLDLTKRQITAIKNGKNIQVSHSAIGNGYDVAMSTATSNKLERAHKNGTGVRISGGDIKMENVNVDKNINNTNHKVNKNLVSKTNAFMKNYHLPSLATDAKIASEIAMEYVPILSSTPRPIKSLLQNEINKFADKKLGGTFRINGGSFMVQGGGLIKSGLTPKGVTEHFTIKDDNKPVLSHNHPAYVTQSQPKFGKMVGDLTNYVDGCPHCQKGMTEAPKY